MARSSYFDRDGIRVIPTPSGRFALAGRVPAALAFETKEGGVPTERQLEGARHAGPGFVGLRTRTWATEAEALAAIEAGS